MPCYSIPMRDADRIRVYGKQAYVGPARQRKEKRFTIRAGDVVRQLRLSGRAPAVCSALKSRQFLRENNLELVHISGPESGQSTTVTYTYEFADARSVSVSEEDAWLRLRGALRDVFADLGGGEQYIRAERKAFYPSQERK